VLVPLRQIDDARPLLREQQPLDTDKVMEDPASRWRLGGLAFLGWTRALLGLQRGAHAIL